MAQDSLTSELVSIQSGAVIVRIQADQGTGYIGSEVGVKEPNV